MSSQVNRTLPGQGDRQGPERHVKERVDRSMSLGVWLCQHGIHRFDEENRCSYCREYVRLPRFPPFFIFDQTMLVMGVLITIMMALVLLI